MLWNMSFLCKFGHCIPKKKNLEGLGKFICMTDYTVHNEKFRRIIGVFLILDGQKSISTLCLKDTFPPFAGQRYVPTFGWSRGMF